MVLRVPACPTALPVRVRATRERRGRWYHPLSPYALYRIILRTFPYRPTRFPLSSYAMMPTTLRRVVYHPTPRCVSSYAL
eukprot:3271945-Rhodomonas_salina.2